MKRLQPVLYFNLRCYKQDSADSLRAGKDAAERQALTLTARLDEVGLPLTHFTLRTFHRILMIKQL